MVIYCQVNATDYDGRIVIEAVNYYATGPAGGMTAADPFTRANPAYVYAARLGGRAGDAFEVNRRSASVVRLLATALALIGFGLGFALLVHF